MRGVFLCLCIVPLASALIFDVESSKSRCIQEVLAKHDLVKASYTLLGDVTEGERSGFTVKVTGPNDVVEFSQADGVGSKFSFTASSSGSHAVCFANGAGSKRTVELAWAAGAAAIDYADVAKVEQLKPLELEMRKLEDRLAAVRREMQRQREREESHRDLSEVTNQRVMTFSALTILIVIAFSLAQVTYLKSYFKANKYI